MGGRVRWLPTRKQAGAVLGCQAPCDMAAFSGSDGKEAQQSRIDAGPGGGQRVSLGNLRGLEG